MVVGAGHAGFHAAHFLRLSGWTGDIAVIDSSPRLPYQRPPLSKEFLWGKQELEDGVFRPFSYFDEHQIELITGHQVRSIERSAKSVVLEGYRSLVYDHLVLATGSTPRVLSIPGADLDGVVRLATDDDARLLRARVARARNVVIVGGGFIGLETAAMVVSAGKRVVVLEANDHIMGRAVTHSMSEYFERVHRSAGVDLRLSTGIDAIEGSGGMVRAVITSAGTTLEADLVIVGIGSRPNDRLAADSGLATDRGVLADSFLRCSDPTVFAIGDCARFPIARDRDVDMVRLESVQNAADQARYVARQIVGEVTNSYSSVPWFWTEQFGRKLQIAGLVGGCDRVEQEMRGPDSFSFMCYSGDTLLGAESVNAPRDHMRVRRHLSSAIAS
ncbi:FAD-dependent oxidoreductase [Rhodococcus jostii]|uniref:NAD(P)/FAD-dependent oxidoreductase n=1 Tax=Rhodococcus jostii TaxID=132919 RepID=UPI001C3FC8CD